MARHRKRRRNKRRMATAYLLRTLVILTFVAVIVFAALFVKKLLSNVSVGEKKADYSENTIELSKDGTIVGDIYEDFAEDYYSQDELSKMIDDEIASYCQLSGDKDAVKLSSFTVEDGKAKLSIEYKDASDYRSFNSQEFYSGKVSDLISAGFSFDQNLVDVSDSTKFISGTDIHTIDDMKAVVTTEDVVLACPSKILYKSTNVELLDKKNARAVPNDSYAIVIYK